MKVSGISPLRKLVNDASSIIIKTMPDAPKSPVEKNITFIPPVMNAVINIMNSKDNEP
jgi:hypothetical protein